MMRRLLAAAAALSLSAASAQVYEQSFFLEMMPRIPQTVVGVSEQQKEAFVAKIDATKRLLDSLKANYRHPSIPTDRSKPGDVAEFESIWNEIYAMHDSAQQLISKTTEEMCELSSQEFARQAELSEQRHKIRAASVKTMNDTSQEEEAIDRAIYENRAGFAKLKAEKLTEAINRYKKLIENFAPKSKRADTLPLPSQMSQSPCAAITNAAYLLVCYDGFTSLFVPPYEP